MRLSLALLPAGSARRVVVLSDGAATTGDTAEAARLAAAAGVSIDTVYLPRPAIINEVILRDVAVPTRVGQGETFRLEIAAESTTATAATLRVLGDEAVVYEEAVQLQPGANNFVVRLEATTPAFARYRVQLAPAPAADTFPQNNELAAFTSASGAYTLTVSASGLSDLAGNAGAGSRSVSWTKNDVLPTAIHGFVYLDLDGSGSYNPTHYNLETPLAGRTIFLDANANGQLDAGESQTVSGSDGGSTSHPRRQPVIKKLLEKLCVTISRSSGSATSRKLGAAPLAVSPA